MPVAVQVGVEPAGPDVLRRPELQLADGVLLEIAVDRPAAAQPSQDGAEQASHER